LHAELLRRARQGGARLIDGEARGFDRGTDGRVRGVLLADGTRIACGHAVNAAGPWARSLAAAAGIALPVHARRRTVFVLSCPEKLPGCPLVIDPSGFWFRPEGAFFIGATTPDPDVDDLPLEPNYAEFSEDLWARMAHRVPAFAALRVERAWAGYYEMNLFDANAFIGAHPAAPNLWFANGFSGHGMQQAPAAGRGVAELILRGRYETLDLAPLGFQRLIENRPLFEAAIIG
jgi:glycine/D-amino acid oxidase-like deaminating enzyme